MSAGRAKISRTLDALKNNKILLEKSIRQLTISYESKKPGNSGTRNFVYETVPSLKYHNPEVDFAVVRDKEPTGITILRADGKLSKLQTKGMDTEGILKELVAMTQSEDARVDDPTRPAWLRQTRLGTGSASTQQA